MLNQDQVKAIEDLHNVYVDAGSMQYNLTGYDETYGWEPIPDDWIEEAIGKLRITRQKLGLSQQKIADLIGTKKRTWQDWEYELTPVPGPVERLLFLLCKYKGASAAILAEYT